MKAIFAIDRNGGMGNHGSLPWPHDTDDMKWFKKHTSGQVVVMGSGTWLDPKMPNPLPNRINVVVSDQPIINFFGADHVIKTYNFLTSLTNIASLYKDKTCWIIGGPTLLMLTRDLITEAVVTHYHTECEADTVLDAVKWFNNTMVQDESYGRNKTYRIYKCNHI
jgi:dihydrofolate reductase